MNYTSARAYRDAVNSGKAKQRKAKGKHYRACHKLVSLAANGSVAEYRGLFNSRTK